MKRNANFSIYQIKDNSDLRPFRFEGSDFMRKHNLWIEQGSYEKKYEVIWYKKSGHNLYK